MVAGAAADSQDAFVRPAASELRMSYRTLKRILGETNFEVKCLVLFGMGLTLLAGITFGLYWWQTASLIDGQNKTVARLMIAPMIQQKHWEWLAGLSEPPPGAGQPVDPAASEDPPGSRSPLGTEPVKLVEGLAGELQPQHLKNFRFEMVDANPAVADSADRPTSDVGYQALQALRGGDDHFLHVDRENDWYNYYAAVKATPSCIECHHHKSRQTPEGRVPVQAGDLIGMARVSLPLQAVESSLHSTNAFVITSEFVKVVLAILAIYLVVRYVITKPVMHLKKVSDAIAHGNLDMRADIRTGDEFEELSHAFNRMLRHLVTVQDELRLVNADLDGKVDELAHVNLQLYEANKLKGEFLATMSHELRTPLNSILGFSDVLREAANLTDKQKKYVLNIQTSGRGLLVLINDVLDLAKIESGKMELHPAEFRVEDLIERQVAGIMPLADRRNIALTWAAADGLPVVFQDPGKLQQILNNLLSNAIKFTPEGGRVKVSAERRGDRIALVVADNGIGIPLDEQDRIFEKFRQGQSTPGQKDTLTRKYEGTGLGLSIVKELVRLLNGEVLLESEFGKGSTFTVIVPVSLSDAEHPDEAATARLVGLNRFRTVDLPGTPGGRGPATVMRVSESSETSPALMPSAVLPESKD